jgi:CHAT domain
MNRLVFQLADSIGMDSARFVTISLEEPPVFGSLGRPFSCTGQEPPFLALREAQLADTAIEQAGRFLYDAVVSHPDLAQYLATALQCQAPQRYPVFVEIATGSGIETLPWETLCSPSGDYLGLDERWAVGRIVDGPGQLAPFWHFKPPLRIAAVLSCLGVGAADEWRALREVVDATGLKVEVLAIVSEQELYDQIEAERQAGATWAKVALVPVQLRELQKLVAEFGPHVLHFFCHGTAQGSPHLQIATKNDWITESPDNSLLVEPREIRDFTARTDDLPWLIVLNCCESAGAGELENLQSVALRLVYDGAVPAVVGMREPVLSGDANLFTSSFYGRLLDDLQVRVGGGPASEDPIEWARFVVEARTQLAKKHRGLTLTQAAASTREWTMPVVYVRPVPFTIRIAPPADAAPTPPPPPPPPPGPGGMAGQPKAGVGPPLPRPIPRSSTAPPAQARSARAARLEIEALRGLLTQLPPGTPDLLREDIQARLDALVRQLDDA